VLRGVVYVCDSRAVLAELDRALARRWVRRHEAAFHGEVVSSDVPPGSDQLPQIKHIIVLMMENHSYDNYLGMLEGRGDGFSTGRDGTPEATNPNLNSDGTAVPLFHPASTRQHSGVPSQSWAASHIQWNAGACDGFVRSLEETTSSSDIDAGMAYWTEEDLPFYYGLARTFPLATRWFSSCLGPTFPNRRFLIAGTAHGLIDDGRCSVGGYPAAGTIFDLLTAHGISWVNYHNKPKGRNLAKAFFGQHVLDAGRHLNLLLAGLIPGMKQIATAEFQFTADMYPRGLLRTALHTKSIEAFFTAAEQGTLPAVTYLDPDFGKWSEEDPQDIQIGESFAADVIDAVTTGPGWAHTLLIWLYDEHGGYYDHVPPPDAPAPDDVPAQSLIERHPWIRWLPLWKKDLTELQTTDAGPRTYERYGFRVPAVVVSPFARPVFATDTIYDHTSILRLIESKWNLPAMTNRDAQATTPLEALSLESTPGFLILPALPAPAQPNAWRQYLR
jgi:phospholipase C